MPTIHDQHFINDIKIVKKSVKAADINSGDIVLEIGPGKGVLTKELAKSALRVIAIELDSSMNEFLSDLPENVRVKYGNALEIIDDTVFNKIVSNIPYSISEPLFKKMLKINFESAVLLVGSNFFELFSDKESKLSVISKVFFKIKKVCDVPRSSFDPAPRVDSVLVKFEKKIDWDDYEKLVKEFVLQDDKKVKNALIYSFLRVKNLTKRRSKELINNLKLPFEFFDKNVDYLSNSQFELVCKEIKRLSKSL